MRNSVKVKNIRPINTTHARLLFKKKVNFIAGLSPAMRSGVVGASFREGLCIDCKHFKFTEISYMEFIEAPAKVG